MKTSHRDQEVITKMKTFIRKVEKKDLNKKDVDTKAVLTKVAEEKKEKKDQK